MEREFHQIKGVPYTAMKIIASSPEEHQQDMKCLTDDIPPGYYLDVRRGSHVITPARGPKIVRPYVMVGLAKVGERLQLENEDSKPIPQKQPKHIEIPSVVKKGENEEESAWLKRLETMAAKNGIPVTDVWRKRSPQLKQADIAAALVKQNAG